MSAPRDDLLRISEIACQAAMAGGADFADASAAQGQTWSVSVERNAIKSSDARRWASVSVRAFSRGATGWASFSGLAEETARRAGEQAAELARAAEPDPDFVDLVGPAPYPNVTGLYDEGLVQIRGAQLAEWVSHNIDAALAVDASALVSGGARVSWQHWALVNNCGVQVSQQGTSASLSVGVLVKRNDDVGSFREWDAARTLAELHPDGLGAKAAKEALSYLGSRPTKTATLPVVLGPLAARPLLEGLCHAASAEEVQRNRSFLIGKQGQQVASEHVSLVDDPLVAGGLASGICDGDGFPHRRVAIVERGVLQTYLHNHYTAKKAGTENTGHSTRGGIAPTNITPALGTKTAEELIAEVEDGIYVSLGQPYPDSASGQVSALVDAGFRIEKGRFTYPLKNTMVAGHGLELLANIDAVSSDYRAEPGMILPTIRVQGVRVAGAA